MGYIGIGSSYVGKRVRMVDGSDRSVMVWGDCAEPE